MGNPTLDRDSPEYRARYSAAFREDSRARRARLGLPSPGAIQDYLQPA